MSHFSDIMRIRDEGIPAPFESLMRKLDPGCPHPESAWSEGGNR